MCDSALTALLGSGCHSMYTDASGNQVFCDGPMSKSAKRGDTATQPGCQGGGGGQNPPSGQREMVWNSLGLRSSIRTDADAARIEQLKQACASVSNGSNIWMPRAGDYSSTDFGMPDPEKCRLAAACPSGQSWNGTACSAGGTGTPSGSCSSELTTLLGSGCHSMSGAYFNGAMTSYVTPGTTQVRECSTSYVSGCTGGGSPGSTCPSGQYWNGTTCISSTPSTSCSSGQYWNGTACVTSVPATGCFSGQYWNGSACVANPGSSCTGSQYWNGSACVSTSPTDCPSGQYWSGSACMANPTGGGASSCTSGQYWNGSACVSSAPAGGSDPATGCASAGGTWDAATSFCRMPGSGSLAPSSFLSSVAGILGGFVELLKSLLR